MVSEPVEDVKVTQRMAIDALADYAKAHEAEKKAKATKESLSKAILKPYLADNPNETLYDGESGLECSLSSTSAPRWLDYADIPATLVVWAVEQELLKPNLTNIDAMIKKGDMGYGAKRFVEAIKPGGEGTPRLKVSKRGED